MLGLLGNRKLNKARKQGNEWVQLADKVDHFRRDVLHQKTLAELREKRSALAAVLKKKESTIGEISDAVEKLEVILRDVGGDFYPRNFISENVDMIVVAAIVAIGIRTFFLQPFKIPTNSMYPTYSGITAEVYFGDEEPSKPEQIFRIAQLGAGHNAIKGKPGEELILPLFDRAKAVSVSDTLSRRGSLNDPGIADRTGGYACIAQEPMRSAKFMRFLILPGPAAFYKFIVGTEEITIKTNPDFPMDEVLRAILQKSGENARLEANKFGYPFVLHTGLFVPEDGSPIVSFDSKTGDMLFVDRFTYHFRAPQVGEPFVFNTGKIPTMEPKTEMGKYYIKRIAGGPGDVLQVKAPVLYRNGKPADAAQAFIDNAEQNGEYEGYLPRVGSSGRYPLDLPMNIPEKKYFAMGDNSDASADSRSWGFVPESAIVGRAVVIYYPFSRRWGLSR